MEGMTLEKLQVIIEAYTKPYKDELEKIKQKTSVATAHVERQTSKMAGSFKKVAAIAGTVLSITALAAFGKSCVQLGSDLAEVQNVVDVTFGNMNRKVDAFSKNAIYQFGLSELAAKRYMGTYGAMAKSFGITGEAGYQMSAAITGLTGDVASFYNLQTDEAYTKLKSIFTGETESLKELGVVMTQTALDQYALNNGFGKTTANMTEQEKVMLRYRFVMSSLADAQGDFARTSGSWANQVRILNLQFESFKATVGQGLINALTPVIQVINAILQKLQTLAAYFKAFTTALFGDAGGADAINSAAAASGTVADNMNKAAGAAKKMKEYTLGIDELNVLNTDSGSGEGVGAGGVGSVPDFGNLSGDIKIGLTSEVDTSGVQKAVDIIRKHLEPLKKIDLSNLNRSFRELREAVKPFTDTLFSGLEWAWNNLFVPLASWTMESALPAFLDLLAAGFRLLNEAVQALQPFWQWAWDHFLQPIASWTGGVIVSVLEGLTKALNGVSGWISENQKAFEVMAGIVAAFFAVWKGLEIAEFVINAGGLVGILGKLKAAIIACTTAKIADKAETAAIAAMYIKDFVVGITQSITALAKQAAQFAVNTAAKAANTVAQAAMTAATAAWNAVCVAATTVTTALSAAIAFLTSPIGLVVIAITGLIAAGVLLYQHWDTVSEYAKKIWTAIKELISRAIEAIKTKVSDTLERIKVAWETAWSAISQFAADIWNGIQGYVASIFQAIAGFISVTAEAIRSKWEQIWDVVRRFWEDIWNKLSNTASTIFTNIKTFISATIEAIRTGFEEKLNLIRIKWDEIWNGLKKTTEDVFGGIWNFIKSTINSILGGIEKMANGVVDGVNRMIDALNNLSFDIPDWVPGIGGEAFGLDIPTMRHVSIPRLESGGLVESGQLFMANESGPELVGKYGGRTGVMNNRQIVDAVSEGVATAVANVMAAFSGQNQSDRPIELTVNLDGRTVSKGVYKAERRGGFKFRPA